MKKKRKRQSCFLQALLCTGTTLQKCSEVMLVAGCLRAPLWRICHVIRCSLTVLVLTCLFFPVFQCSSRAIYDALRPIRDALEFYSRQHVDGRWSVVCFLKHQLLNSVLSQVALKPKLQALACCLKPYFHFTSSQAWQARLKYCAHSRSFSFARTSGETKNSFRWERF